MCGSMADIQSAAAEIRRGKKKKEERTRKKKKKNERRTNHSMKIYMVSLFHRATINKHRPSVTLFRGSSRYSTMFVLFPGVQGHIASVYHTSTHDVALVRI